MEIQNDLLEHKTLKIEHSEIHYFISGNKQFDLVVFLHPAFSDHRAFNQQINFFQKTHCVISIDLIGHGFSKAKKSKDKIDPSSDHLESIIKKEGFLKAHIIGVSMGALVAQHFALIHPTMVKSLTALGGYNINTIHKEISKAQRASNFILIIRALFSMNSFRKKTAELTCISEEGKALFYESASRYERKSFMVMQGLQNIIKERPSIKPTYPMLIVTGEFDIDLALKVAKKWHKKTDNSEYQIIKNAGHCANMDRPAAFNTIVENFIQKTNEQETKQA